MTSPEAVLVGARLDEDHAPATNGWMSVCRRCGAYTDGPLGKHHIPSDLRLGLAEQWLEVHAPPRRREGVKAAVTV